MSDALDEFERLLHQKGKSQILPEVIWVTAKEINWEEKTMTATSIVDDLDYYDVLLGLGSFFRKPRQGTKCVIAKLENSNGTILIDAEEFDQAIFTSQDTNFIIKQTGFIVKVGNESLKEVLNDWQAEFGKLADEINKIEVSIGVTPNVPAITEIKNKVTTAIKNRLNTILIE